MLFLWYYIYGDYMKSVGIICEYNPFHNGHLYHINKIKEIYPDSIIIAVMSGNFTQRGELSIIDKWDKTRIAIKHGIDLVIELPFIYSSQSADIFCKGAIEILSYLKVDAIVFGSESDNVEFLKEIAKVQLNNKNYNKLVKHYMNEGVNYPTAISKALEVLTNKNITNPNDILGVGYIKEIIKNNYNIEIKTIKRTNNYNDKNTSGYISSATSIRNLLKENKNIQEFVPEFSHKFLNKKLFFIDDYYPFIKYKILTEINSLDNYQTVDEGISNRIKKYINDCENLEQLIMKIKTKRYTYNKIKRMFVHILVGFTKEDAKDLLNSKLKYIRVLGFTKIGRKHLNTIKKEIDIPIITNYSNSKGLLDLENRVNSILCINLPLNKQKEFIEKEYKQKPIIK